MGAGTKKDSDGDDSSKNTDADDTTNLTKTCVYHMRTDPFLLEMSLEQASKTIHLTSL